MTRFALAALSMTLATQTAHAGATLYIKILDVPGESQTAGLPVAVAPAAEPCDSRCMIELDLASRDNEGRGPDGPSR